MVLCWVGSETLVVVEMKFRVERRHVAALHISTPARQRPAKRHAVAPSIWDFLVRQMGGAAPLTPVETSRALIWTGGRQSQLVISMEGR